MTPRVTKNISRLSNDVFPLSTAGTYVASIEITDMRRGRKRREENPSSWSRYSLEMDYSRLRLSSSWSLKTHNCLIDAVDGAGD